MSKDLQIWSKEEEKASFELLKKKRDNTINFFLNETNLDVNALMANKKFMEEIYGDINQIQDRSMLENITTLKAGVIERALFLKAVSGLQQEIEKMDDELDILETENEELRIKNEAYNSFLTGKKIDAKSIEESARIHMEKLEKGKEIIRFNRRKSIKEIVDRTNARIQRRLNRK